MTAQENTDLVEHSTRDLRTYFEFIIESISGKTIRTARREPALNVSTVSRCPVSGDRPTG